MPGTNYQDGDTADLLSKAGSLQLSAWHHDERAKEYRALLKEVCIELRSRNVSIITVSRALGVTPQRVSNITKGDERVYGPEYVAEQARLAEVHGDAVVREPGPG